VKKHKSIIIGLIVGVISFVLMYTGIRFINSTGITTQNIAYYVLFSLILGGISAVFHFYRLKYALILFLAGIVIGYFEMFRRFMDNLDGWGDLAGLLSLFMFIAAGLIAGIIVQIVHHFYKKYKKA
jgi:drug/metabolite transporter (DMT)-like permease